MGKALVSGLVSLIIVLAASTPGAISGIAAQSELFDKEACVLLASAALEEASGSAPVTVSLYSPFQTNVDIAADSVSCSGGGVTFQTALAGESLPQILVFTGEDNVSVANVGGVLEWWC